MEIFEETGWEKGWQGVEVKRRDRGRKEWEMDWDDRLSNCINYSFKIEVMVLIHLNIEC